MATLPPEDQELIDSLNEKMIELHRIEMAAVQKSDHERQRAAHAQISKMRGLIQNVIDYQAERQIPPEK
jgi:hypothetical protein